MIDKTDESEEFKDDLIRGIVRKGARTLPDANFEDQMMLKIQNELDYKNEVSSQLKTSLRFFVGALLSGISLMLVVLFGKVFAQYEIKTIAILALFVMSLVGILNVNNYQRLIKKYSW